MILFEIAQTEDHPAYRELEVSNGNRQASFLESVILASLQARRNFLSQQVIMALNFHAITCLHTNPGEYRPCAVSVGSYVPPAHYRVAALMDDFVNQVNRAWDSTDAVALSTYVLWRLNHIHPFINGNGRTARAAAYFVLCLKSGGLLDGSPTLPQLLRMRRDDCTAALRRVDQSFEEGRLDLDPLHRLVVELIEEQLESVDGD